jgi:hypothetical protein
MVAQGSTGIDPSPIGGMSKGRGRPAAWNAGRHHRALKLKAAPVFGGDKRAVCFGFLQLLATKRCCGLPNAQLFSQLL